MTEAQLSRRDFLGGLAAAGAGTLLAGRELYAQAKPRLINVHHHLTSPGYVKFLMDNKVREFPNKSVAEGLEDMDKAVFRAVGPAERPATVLAALGPKMLRLSAEKADGAHPYFVPVEHTAQAREILGPDPILAVEQMVVLDTDRARGLETARKGMAVYLRAPNYVNNLKRYGFSDEDVTDGASERLVDAIVAVGDVNAARERIQAHFDAGASHVCAQILTADGMSVPAEAWQELAAAVADLNKQTN